MYNFNKNNFQLDISKQIFFGVVGVHISVLSDLRKFMKFSGKLLKYVCTLTDSYYKKIIWLSNIVNNNYENILHILL